MSSMGIHSRKASKHIIKMDQPMEVPLSELLNIYIMRNSIVTSKKHNEEKSRRRKK